MAGLSMHALGYVFNRIFTEVGNRGASYFGVSWFALNPFPAYPLATGRLYPDFWNLQSSSQYGLDVSCMPKPRRASTWHGYWYSRR